MLRTKNKGNKYRKEIDKMMEVEMGKIEEEKVKMLAAKIQNQIASAVLGLPIKPRKGEKLENQKKVAKKVELGNLKKIGQNVDIEINESEMFLRNQSPYMSKICQMLNEF